PATGRAETLIAAASPAVVRIEQNFTGAEITVFGTIERDRVAVSRADPYHIAVVVIGPPERVVVRRKSRIVGLWINT
ncbi:TIGR02186 family protein, partial [Mycobacterium tuberculosis]|nr:TIGR02186 family protein [Mycobacterium tuberculosis]